MKLPGGGPDRPFRSVLKGIDNLIANRRERQEADRARREKRKAIEKRSRKRNRR